MEMNEVNTARPIGKDVEGAHILHAAKQHVSDVYLVFQSMRVTVDQLFSFKGWGY
jgi:hypothetical protein